VLRGSTFHRVTTVGAGPWWFSSGGGRFDLEPPRGTCYLADDPLVALLESLGPLLTGPTIAASLLAGRQLWEVALPEQCDAADCTARPARRFGVTGEIGSVTPYTVPRRWAQALAAAGFGGVRYRARHDPAGGRCLALFGIAGERRRWRRGRGRTVADAGLEHRLLTEVGIRVAREAPPDDALDLLD
jgi:hypothetical protein